MAFFETYRGHPRNLLAATDLAAEYQRLREENAQLQRAVASHALIDQAIGAVVVLGQVPPEDGWRVLLDVSQHTNTKLRTVAGHVLDYARGGALPQSELDELRKAFDRHRTGCPAGRAET
ncbi:ANTAR domain-containing protein [Streptomyces sp. NPDC046197]|uniref:ANTAR domain-containing protein n=1 Tax=Streptomyces sp. NPDC046197 TaxID=3154337 RepID=UPI0033F313B6